MSQFLRILISSSGTGLRAAAALRLLKLPAVVDCADVFDQHDRRAAIGAALPDILLDQVY